MIAEPSDISRVMKEMPAIWRCRPRSMVMKARLPSPAEAHSVDRLPSTAFAPLKALLHCELTATTLEPMAMSGPASRAARCRERSQLPGLEDKSLGVCGREPEPIGCARGQPGEDDGVAGYRCAAHVGVVCDRPERRRPPVGDGAHSRRVRLQLHYR